MQAGGRVEETFLRELTEEEIKELEERAMEVSLGASGGIKTLGSKGFNYLKNTGFGKRVTDFAKSFLSKGTGKPNFASVEKLKSTLKSMV